MATALSHLVELLHEHEHRLDADEWRTPRGLYSSICDSAGDERDPVVAALRADAEIIIGLAEDLDRADTALEDIYREGGEALANALANRADPP